MAREFTLNNLSTFNYSTKNTVESSKHISIKQQPLSKKYFESKPKNEKDPTSSTNINSRYDIKKQILQPAKQPQHHVQSLQIQKYCQLKCNIKEKENSPFSKIQSSCSNYSTKYERSNAQKDISQNCYFQKTPQNSQENKSNKFIKCSSDAQIQHQPQIILKNANCNKKRLSDPMMFTPLSSMIRQSQKKHSSMMEQEQLEVKKFVISEQPQIAKFFIEPVVQTPVKECFFSLKDDNLDNQCKKTRSISDERIKCFTIGKIPKQSTKMHTQGKNEAISNSKMNKLYEYILDVDL